MNGELRMKLWRAMGAISLMFATGWAVRACWTEYCAPFLDLRGPIDLEAGDAAILRHNPRFAGRLVRTGPPDPLYNCHGWTFTRGAVALSDADARERLETGGYRQIDQPRPGDIIIYQDVHGDIMHSGIVTTVDDTGNVLVESKFGQFGRYIHEPSVPRHARFAYFRRVVDPSPPELVGGG